MDFSEARWVLWHIPSSTRLISTERKHEVRQLVTNLLTDGIPICHLMLQVEHAGGVLGGQWTGEHVQTALQP